MILMRRTLWLAVIGGFLAACGGTSRGPDGPGTDGQSSLSSISLGLPDRSRLSADAQTKMNGFHVILEPVPAGCNGAATIDVTQAWENGSTSHKIMQGCDWSVGVELGKLDAAGTRLESVYFSNWGGPGLGQKLAKETFAGKPAVAMGVVLKITQAGVAAGLAGAVSGGGSTDLVVDVVVGNPPPGTGTGTGTDPGTGTGTGPGSGADYDWRQDVTLVDVKEVGWSGQDFGSAYFKDVMNHTNDRFTTSSASTNAHETMHGLLNGMNNATSAKDQFVYVESGKGFYVTEPAMHASKIKDYLPAGAKALAGSRMQLYLVQQVSAYFPNVLYQFDEWKCYTTNGRVALEIHKAGNWRDGGVDEIDGAVDFLYFASAAIHGLKLNEPDYLKTNRQFKAAFAYLAEASVKNAEAGLLINEFKGFHAGKLLEHYRTSPENEAIRMTVREFMGAAWTKRVLGF